MADIPLTCYAGVCLRGWASRSSAGDALMGWQQVAAGRRSLVRDPHWGYLGRLAPDGEEAPARLATLARPPWATIADLPGAVGWSVSSSKGMIGPLLGQPQAFLASLPGMQGPSLAQALGVTGTIPCPVAAACATGLYGLLAIADLMARGQARRGLCVASDCNLTPLVLAGFSSLGVSCTDSPPASRVTDATARSHGFAPAEGLGAAALAEQGPWRLQAGVRLSDAASATRFADPAVLAAALAALWTVAPHPQLVLCHATGTGSGDAYELAALAAGPWRSVPRLACKPLIGHCLGASALVELALACSSPVASFWQLSLGFGGHLAAIAVRREL